jgi:hypothetical protein
MNTPPIDHYIYRKNTITIHKALKADPTLEQTFARL